MADDEVLVPIPKDFWPKGVMRGLAPALRSVGDKNGNLVIVAQQAKEVIMVKGPADKIDKAKPEIRAVVQEYFPEAPVPDELWASWEWEAYGAEAGANAEAAEEPPKSSAPAAKPAPAPAPAPAPIPPAAPKPAAAAAPPIAAPVATGPPQPPVSGRKRPASATGPSPDLIWECVKHTSSFIRRPLRDMRKPFSAEPQNLLGLHSFKYSGLAANEALDVRPVKRGAKESVELVQSHAKPSRQRRPATSMVSVGLSKCPKRGLLRLDREVDAKFYRRSLHSVARLKYLKVVQSFKKKKRVTKSRRAK